jgi:hypothetical protein
MKALHLGLFQLSPYRFGVALHDQGGVAVASCEFDAGDLRAALIPQAGGGLSIDLQAVPPDVRRAREAVLELIDRDVTSFVAGGLMALDSVSDSWGMTVLPHSLPGYHVALAFSFYPLRMISGPERLVHLAEEDSPAANQLPEAAWNLLHPAVVEQAAALAFPSRSLEAGTASGCALLSAHPGVLTYLFGLGDTFSLTDIEYLARARQVSSSIVVAQAQGLRGDDRSWMYRVKLSDRAIEQVAQLALGYARAKARIERGLRRRPPRAGLNATQNEFREAQVGRFAHHLAILALCIEFGIGLWSRPRLTSAENVEDIAAPRPARRWAMAVAPERRPDSPDNPELESD